MEDPHELTFAAVNESEEVWMRTKSPVILFMICLLAESTSILDKKALFFNWLVTG
jgi:hypothetical protein